MLLCVESQLRSTETVFCMLCRSVFMNINKPVGVTDWLCVKLQISTAFFLNVTSLSSGLVAVATGLFVVGGNRDRQTPASGGLASLPWWCGATPQLHALHRHSYLLCIWHFYFLFLWFQVIICSIWVKLSRQHLWHNGDYHKTFWLVPYKWMIHTISLICAVIVIVVVWTC